MITNKYLPTIERIKTEGKKNKKKKVKIKNNKTKIGGRMSSVVFQQKSLLVY